MRPTLMTRKVATSPKRNKKIPENPSTVNKLKNIKNAISVEKYQFPFQFLADLFHRLAAFPSIKIMNRLNCKFFIFSKCSFIPLCVQYGRIRCCLHKKKRKSKTKRWFFSPILVRYQFSWKHLISVIDLTRFIIFFL
jgi:hypothetical protein